MRGQAANLVLATWISVVNFWAWNLIGPLSTSYARDMSLSSAEASLLVATPILVGALGRIVTGPLTDRFGGRAMLIAVTLASILPVLAVGVAATMGSYALLVFFGLFLGVAGTIFAVGIPFANNWYQPARRGFSTGVFGMGMVGTALSAFFTPRFVRWFGLFTTHAIVAAALASTAVVAMVVLRDAPYFRPNADPVLPRLKAAARLPVTWEMSFLYAIVFGGFVAFSNYLPTYITTIYGFSTVDAGARTAGFALAAVLARPVGGWLSDRIAPRHVVLASLAGTALLAFTSGGHLHHPGGLPRRGHRRRVRVGGPPRPGRIGRLGHRNRRRGRRIGRLLPAAGDGRDLRPGRQRLHGRVAAAGGDRAGRVYLHRAARAGAGE